MPEPGSNGLPAIREYMAATPSAAGRRGTTTDDVTHALREAILDGVLPPGAWLREQDLAEALRVSRTPIRDAIGRLAEEQLVDRSTNRGAVVRAMGLDEILAVYVVRASLEGLAARIAANRQLAGLIERLTAVHDEMTAALNGPARALAVLNLQFHRAIREAAGNAYLDRFLRQVEHAVRRFGTTTYDDPHRAVESLDEHWEIVQAIASGDGDRAERAATAHMYRARQARIAALVGGLDAASTTNEARGVGR